MSVYDWSASIKITFDKPIVTETVSAAGFTITGYEPFYSPEGSLVQKTYTIKRIEKAVDNLSIKIFLTLAGRMKYPIGNITVTYSKVNGNLAGAYGSYVEDFIMTFSPANITPIFNPADVERISITFIPDAHTHDISYVYARNAYENIEISFSGTAVLKDTNGIPV